MPSDNNNFMTRQEETSKLLGTRVIPFEPDSLENIMQSAVLFACNIWGITEDELKEKYTRKYTGCRWSIVYALHEIFPVIAWQLIGAQVFIDRTTAIYGYKQMDFLVKRMKSNIYSVSDKERLIATNAFKIMDYLKQFTANPPPVPSPSG